MLNDALSRQIVQRLDQLETGLIQHVRTSALKKEREVFLIDEVLKSCSALSMHVESKKTCE